MKEAFSYLVALFLVSAFTGCAHQAVRPQFHPSGFLGDSQVYNSMTADPDTVGVMVYKGAPYPANGYDSFIVPPVTIHLSQTGMDREISEEDLEELAQKFRADVIQELGSRYQVIEVPAARVAILRLALTDAKPNSVLMNLPLTSILTGGAPGGATIEGELVDSTTGRRINALMASATGETIGYGSSFTRWGETEAVLENWAKVLAARIDEGRS